MGVSGWVFLLVPAYPGSPGPTAVKRLCVCVFHLFEVLELYQVVEMTVMLSVTWCLGGMSGVSYSLPRSSDFMDEQKMDVSNDSGEFL